MFVIFGSVIIKKQKIKDILANCSCDKDCNYTCIVWNKIKIFGVPATMPENKLNAIYAGDYTNAIKGWGKKTGSFHAAALKVKRDFIHLHIVGRKFLKAGLPRAFLFRPFNNGNIHQVFQSGLIIAVQKSVSKHPGIRIAMYFTGWFFSIS